MKLQPATLIGLVTMASLAGPVSASPLPDDAAILTLKPAPTRMAQATPGDAPTAQPSTTDDGSPAPIPPGLGLPKVAPPAASGTSKASPGGSRVAPVAAPSTGATRNGANRLSGPGQPGPGQPGTGQQATPLGTGTPTGSYGGPQTTLQPVYGSSLRDSGGGGSPVYSNGSPTLGGPINGTANTLSGTTPGGVATPGQTTTGAGRDEPNNPNRYTRQPLGGTPVTRDQIGTFGGRAGYNAQGVYNGTAAQSGTGFGYGSPYAPIGRPTGGLLSTNVDATGPLRPYIPLDNHGPISRPNSGYGVPNGSRPTHMDGRGVQRLD